MGLIHPSVRPPSDALATRAMASWSRPRTERRWRRPRRAKSPPPSSEFLPCRSRSCPPPCWLLSDSKPAAEVRRAVADRGEAARRRKVLSFDMAFAVFLSLSAAEWGGAGWVPTYDAGASHSVGAVPWAVPGASCVADGQRGQRSARRHRSIDLFARFPGPLFGARNLGRCCASAAATRCRGAPCAVHPRNLENLTFLFF